MVDKKVALWKYPQPQLGDQFGMNMEYLDKHHVGIKELTETKYKSVLLVIALEFECSITIQEKDVSATLHDIDHFQKLITKVATDRNRSLIRILSLQNRYSLFTYLVRYHFDVFMHGLFHPARFCYLLQIWNISISPHRNSLTKIDFYCCAYLQII